MTKFLQTLIDALAMGSLYALIALGYTMVYGTLKFINFAHGTLFMLSAWFSFALAREMGWTAPDADIPFWAAGFVILAVVIAISTMSVIIEFLAYRPLRSAPRLNVLITAIGVALLLENVAVMDRVFGTQSQGMPLLMAERELGTFYDVTIRSTDVKLFVMAVVFMMALQVLVYGTKIGSAMRAVSQDARTASLMGINVNRTISITFLVGSALAAVAGFLFVMKSPSVYQPAAPVWTLLGLKAFVAAVVGGIGNIRGAMLGGLLIAFVELFGAAYLSPQLRDVYVFSLLILVLLFLPSGILGKSTIEKV